MIVVLTQCFPPVLGGIENLMAGLAGALSGLDRKVIVLADGHRDRGEAAYDRRLDYPVRRISGVKPWRQRRKAAALGELLDTGNVRAIFTDSWKSAEHAIPKLREHDVPLVCLAHGNDVLAEDDARRRHRISRILSSATRIAANSVNTAERVQALGVDPARIAVVNPGVTPPERPERDVVESVAARIGEREHLLLTVARIEPRKGQDQVLRSMPALLSDYPELTYAIAGDGPYREQLEQLARHLSIARRVRFLGRVSEAEKSALLELADLFVMPAREDVATRSVEGFGIAYVEAAFRALPTVAGRSGGVADAVLDGVTGLLCDGNDAGDVERTIRDCLADPGRRTQLGIAARQRAEREFTWPVAAKRYLACLEPIAS